MTNMNQERIATALQAAIDAVGDQLRAHGVQPKPLPREPAWNHPSICLLTETLRMEPTLAFFDNAVQRLGGGAVGFQVGQLTQWLVLHGKRTSADQATADLYRYIHEKNIQCKMILAISNLIVEQPFALSDGMMLVPWDELPDTNHKQAVAAAHDSVLSFTKRPTAALVRDVIQGKFHQPDSEDVLRPIDDSELIDAALILGVAGRCAPGILATWVEPPEWVPVVGAGFSFHPNDEYLHYYTMTKDISILAATLYGRFRSLDSKSKDAIRLPMQRLNVAMRRRSNVDSAIDLGIAFESLFLDGHNDSEITFKLKLRSARYLGDSKVHRKEIFEMIGHLYGARSKAVHTGKIHSTKNIKSVSVLLV